MLQMVKYTFTIIMAIAVCSCNNLDVKGIFMPTGEGIEKRFEQSAEMNSGLKKAAIESQSNYMFYVAADPHIEHEHKNLDIFNDALRNDENASFGVLLGDCSELRDNLDKYIEALTYYPERHSYNHEIFHILGNHDVFFNGWVNYRKKLGASVYWFEVLFPEGKDLYICLDTATGTLGRKQSDWFRTFLEENRKSYRHCVILTHTNLFYTDNTQAGSGNMPIEETFSLIDFFGKQDVTLVLQGHDHYREDLFYDNVRYTILGTIKDESDKAEYLKVNVNADKISYDWQLISR